MKTLNALKTGTLMLTSAVALSACATTAGGSGSTAALEAARVYECLRYDIVGQASDVLGRFPGFGDSGSEEALSQAAGVGAELDGICDLQTFGQRYVASAELSRTSLLYLAKGVGALQTAQGYRSAQVDQIARRLEATPAYEIDVTTELSAIAQSLTEFEADYDARVAEDGPVELSPTAQVEVARASAQIRQSARYLGQSLGTVAVLYNQSQDMSSEDWTATAVELAAFYDAAGDENIFESFVSDLGASALGTARSSGGIFSTASKLSRISEAIDPAAIREAEEEVRELADSEVGEIYDRIQTEELT